MISLKQFGKDMEKLADEFPERADKIKRQVALQTLTQVTLETPVDTGRARANWQIGRGAPIDSKLPAFAPGISGNTGASNSNRAIREGRRKLEIKSIGLDIYLTNNVPYIVPLNEGSSEQAPKRFVQSAIKRAVKSIQASEIIEDKP